MINDSQVTNIQPVSTTEMGRRDLDRMMIIFISTYTISNYVANKPFSSILSLGEANFIKLSDSLLYLRHVVGFLRVLRFSSNNHIYMHNIAQILLKVH